jgi:glutamate-1-semialdehyde aminotransferase
LKGQTGLFVAESDVSVLIGDLLDNYRKPTFGESAPTLCAALSLLQKLQEAQVKIDVAKADMDRIETDLQQSISRYERPHLDIMELQIRFLLRLTKAASPGTVENVSQRLYKGFERNREAVCALMRASACELDHLPPFWASAFDKPILDDRGNYKRFLKTLFEKYGDKFVGVIELETALKGLHGSERRTVSVHEKIKPVE